MLCDSQSVAPASMHSQQYTVIVNIDIVLANSPCADRPSRSLPPRWHVSVVHLSPLRWRARMQAVAPARPCSNIPLDIDGQDRKFLQGPGSAKRSLLLRSSVNVAGTPSSPRHQWAQPDRQVSQDQISCHRSTP